MTKKKKPEQDTGGRVMNQAKSSRNIDGSVYAVRCPCGHVETLCLAQGATAIVCLACKEELALPTTDLPEGPPGWFPGEDRGLPSIVKDDDSNRFDTDADACIHALALLLKGDAYTAETYDFEEVAEAIKGSIDMALLRRSEDKE